MEADVRWCPHCRQSGEKKRLRLLQINDSLAVLLCENEKCVGLGETSSTSTVIHQRKASDIPNTRKKKNKLLPACNAAPKIPDSSPPNGSIQSSDAGNAESLSEKQACGTPIDSKCAINNASPALRAGSFSSTAMPQVALWANKSALCWLDACLCLLVACRSLHTCVAKLPAKSSVRTLCTAFVEAQRPRTTKKSETQDSCCDESQLSEASVLPPVRLTCTGDTSTNAVHSNTDITRTAQSEQDSLHSTRNAEFCQTKGESDPLDKARDEIYRRLQPMMKCESGEEDSPVVALASLLRLDGSVEEHFMCQYRWEFCCSVCGFTQVNRTKKTMPTFTSVPADFSMKDPVMLHSCHKCGAQQQRSRLVFHSLSACVMMHFQGGLPDSDLSKHHTFIFSGDAYTLAAVVRYRGNPNHFVTLVRDQETNHWLEYDDLMPSPFTWQPEPPSIPAHEIHIMVWERSEKPCTACAEMHLNVTGILDAPVHTPASGVPVGDADAAPQQHRSAQWNGNGSWRKSKFSLSNSFWRKSVQERDATNRSDSGRHSSGPAKVGQETSDAIDVDKETNGSGVEIDLTAEMESAPTVDEGLEESKSDSFGNLDPQSLSKVDTKETPKVPRSNQNATKKPQRNARTEHLQDGKSVISLKTNAARKPELNTDAPQPTFLRSLLCRRKSNKDKDQTTTTAAILAKIPDQLMKFSRHSNVSSRPRIGSAPSNQESTSRNASVLSKIPKQLLSGSANPRAAPSQQSQSELSRPAARPKLVGSSRRVPVKQVKFQPYEQNLELKIQQENKKNLPVKQGIRSNASTLNSWQKRVGKYSSSVDVPRKRVRRDSSEDSSSTYSDLPKHAGPPCSSVSSPSACSDISSLSDNQLFASGRNDLTNTIDELCKVLDIGGDYTPPVSSRLSSPSQDMFFSELFTNEPVSERLDPISHANSTGLQMPLASFDNHAPVTMATEMSATSSTSHTHLHSSIHEHCPSSVTAPSVESFRPAATALSTSTPMGSNKLQTDLAAANISSPNPLEGTLPSVGTERLALAPVGCPAQSQSAMLPSCDSMQSTIDPVAMQQDSDRPMQHVDNSPVSHVASHGDHMTAASGFSSLTDTESERNIMAFSSSTHCEAAQAMDDIIDTGLFEDIQESLDMLGSEWNENLIELLAQ
ncbi:uncharacterized protein LOC119724660 [Patiria miniata]|uniref:USP domain-containing protein n=1 Tax=Patiria miniata TaxID=46514 RepID=A0A913ZL18_PATMI|nr:uncharacterized protein LOC119724660 [Patiria miniata]